MKDFKTKFNYELCEFYLKNWQNPNGRNFQTNKKSKIMSSQIKLNFNFIKTEL